MNLNNKNTTFNEETTFSIFQHGFKGKPIFKSFSKKIKFPETKKETDILIKQVVKEFNDLNKDSNVKAIAIS